VEKSLEEIFSSNMDAYKRVVSTVRGREGVRGDGREAGR